MREQMTALVGPDTGRFSTLSLAELNARAALLDREENKYLVDPAALTDVLSGLEDRFEVLAIDGVNEFTYDTVYFDTAEHRCYRDHAAGKRLRMKIRTRRYVDSGDLCFFEVKLKGNRGRTIKERYRCSVGEHGVVTEGAINFVGAAVERHYGRRFTDPLVAALGMRYRRVTLVGVDAPERVTIDFGFDFRCGGAEVEAAREVIIVEVKSTDGRGVADSAFRAAGCRSQSCSKYCVGLNLIDVGVPHNSFNRLLRSHFDWNGART